MSAAAQPESGQAGPAAWRPRVNPWLIALSVMLATFMEVLDTSIASVALPHIAGNLGASTDEATWVLTSYLVSNAIILPTSAWFGSFFGRKRFLIGCIILFTVSSFVCGAATSLGMLIVARVVQGAGGGALQPLAQAILLESFPPARRGVAMAVYGVGVIVAPIIGPTLGGWLTDSYSWRWAFYINLPVGVLAIFLISLFVEDPPYIRGTKRGRFDAIGFAFLTLWLATLQITLDKGQEVDWFGAVWLRWFAGISVVSFVCFIIRELCAQYPVVNLRTLKNRNFAAGCGVFLMFGAALYALVTMLPLFLQTLLGYTALDAGLTVSPRGLGVLIALGFVGLLAQRVNLRLLMVFGFTVLGAACFLLSRLNLQVAMSNIIPANLLMGFGMGFIFVPLTTLSVSTLPNDQIGNATGIQNLMRNVGGSVGISWLSTMLARYAQAHQAFMVGHVSSLDPAYKAQLGVWQKVFASNFGPVDALQRAQAYIYNTLVQQTNYWAYVNAFYMVMWACALCLVGAGLFQNVKSSRTVAMH
ncbi:MAG TPA: DHA2 family efflux MFS transporter permease subunit [Candidatus Saccharimonadales bacterium]|nr:DHA2 family efflux MFS transporter permease subunit [Candidatus Saccharimonadales bacterium]